MAIPIYSSLISITLLSLLFGFAPMTSPNPYLLGMMHLGIYSFCSIFAMGYCPLCFLFPFIANKTLYQLKTIKNKVKYIRMILSQFHNICIAYILFYFYPFSLQFQFC